MFAFSPFNEQLLTAVFNSAVFWGLSLLFLCLSYAFLDKALFPKTNFEEELKKGNVALAIVIAAFMGSIGLIIFGVTN